MELKYLHIDNITLEIHNFNDDFILLKNESNDSLPLIGQAIFDSKFDFVDEVIATHVEIYIKLKSQITDEILNSLSQIKWKKSEESKVITLPIYFDDNPDWIELTTATNLTRQVYIDRLLDCELRVMMYGFMPGFLYLDGLDAALMVPRKTTPNKRIPANSFAIGGPYAGIYSLGSPGGWHVLGSLATSLYDQSVILTTPDTLEIGQTIKLKSITQSQLKESRLTLNNNQYNSISTDDG